MCVDEYVPKIIMHVDMDMFFAAVEIRDNPSLRDLPIVIGGPSDRRGVVSCASYNARKFGIHAGMPNYQAARLCSELVFVTPNYDKYVDASRELHNVLTYFSPYVEMFSVDEAFLDMTGCVRLFGNPLTMVKKVKYRIKRKTGLTCSIGIAPTKYLAKYAAGVNKPNGHFIISPEILSKILPKIPVKKISGVGPHLQKVLSRLGVITLGDVLNFSEEYWRSRLGKIGYWLFSIASGKELDPVTPVSPTKSMGKEFTLKNDTDDYQQIRKYLLFISENVAWRLRKYNYKAKTISIKVRDSSFFTSSIQVTLPEPTFFHDDIFNAALQLFTRVDLRVKSIRLIGITASGLIPVERGAQLSLFTYRELDKKIKLAEATDKIWKKYGKFKVKPAALLENQIKDYPYD